jgi:hypothetical protein
LASVPNLYLPHLLSAFEHFVQNTSGRFKMRSP